MSAPNADSRSTPEPNESSFVQDPQVAQPDATEPGSDAADGQTGWLETYSSYFGTVLSSVILHAAVLLLLASIMLPIELDEEVFLLMNGADTEEELFEPTVDVVVQPERLVPNEIEDAAASIETVEITENPTPVVAEIDADKIAGTLTLTDAESIISTLRGDFSGRTEKGKLASLRKFGGTADSERAVNEGLRWLATVQSEDGSWDYIQVGNAGNAGVLQQGQMGATAMALLCYLGAGHSHASETQYAPNVKAGLNYLLKNVKTIAREADLRGDVRGNGGMYIQGLATIALCEAHALTRGRNEDRNLKAIAQAAIRFIEEAQDREGGWRYQPRTGADTSVVGWQVMALKSGRAAKLRVKSDTFSGVRKFLNRVQSSGGAMYGYTKSEENRQGTTAIGLLCRMYMGWNRERDALKRGVEFLSKRGPSRDDAYYNYYASQVLHHWGGKPWKKWNSQLRPQLVESQVQNGSGKGSWNPAGRHSGQGGRIYETALSVMTLEVYYRHLPLYRRSAVAAKDDAADQ